MKKHHPAARARNFTGAVSALTLVAMVTGFQFAAASEAQNAASSTNATPVPSEPSTSDVTTANGSGPTAPEVPAPETVGSTGAQVPGPVAEPVSASAVSDVAPPAPAPPVPDVAPAPPAPDPAPVPAPPSGTTAGS